MTGIGVDMTRTNIDDFVNQVEAAPSWVLITPDELQKRGRQLDLLGTAFQAFSPQDARAIVKQLSDQSKQRGGTDEPERTAGQIYVLLRFYFCIPKSERAENAKYFGGWLGVPERDARVSILWPLEEHADGSIHLDGAFEGYFGDTYDALGEFDYFNSKYGPRKLKGEEGESPVKGRKGDTSSSP